MSGHRIVITEVKWDLDVTSGAGPAERVWQELRFGCTGCDLHGKVRSSPPGTAASIVELVRIDHEPDGGAA